jgi:hypothetical protein
MSFGRSGNYSGLHHKLGRQRLVHPALGYGSAQWRASPGSGLAKGARRIFGDKQDRTGEEYQPVLAPQLGQDLVDGLSGALIGSLGQVSVDGSRGRGGMSQICLDDTQIEPGFQQMGGIGMT